MVSVKQNTTIREYQNFVKEVYGLSNDRYFNIWDMITNMERFMMRGLKGIRKKDNEKTKINFLIAFSWFASITNQLHVDIEKEVWKRFPHLCSYCASCPCCCKESKIEKRKEEKSFVDGTKKPTSLEEFQEMFNQIYPAQQRTLEHAGIHLVEEAGEFSEAILAYRGTHKDEVFRNVEVETADFFSCLMSIFNSLEISVAKELSVMFSNNCHLCKNAPCACNFKDITDFKS